MGVATAPGPTPTTRILCGASSRPAVRVSMRTARSHEADCEQCETEDVGIARVERRVEMTGPLTDEQRKRLLQIADRCPVKQTLERGIRVEPAA